MRRIETGAVLQELDVSQNTSETSFQQESTTNMSLSIKLETPSRQSQLKKRVSRLLKRPENKYCLDCSKANPRWITILSVPPPYNTSNNHHNLDTFFIGGFCCLECSGAHRRLGTHVSFVRSIELDSLKESDVQALEYGGNDIVNRIFEGHLFDTSMGERCVNVVSSFSPGPASKKPDSNANQKAREYFIRKKYEKKLYTDLKELSQFRQSMISSVSLGDALSPCDDLVSPTSSSSSSNNVSSSPVKLQVFTSSPRTLAMIEKYLNPKKSKRKIIGRMIRNSLCRRGPRSAKKRYLKKSLQGLRGIVGVNPNVNIVETRSEELVDSDSECDSDKDSEEILSVTSTQSSMSAFIRGNCAPHQKSIRRYEHITKKMHRVNTPSKGEKKKRVSRNKQKQNKNRSGSVIDLQEEELESLQLNDENAHCGPTPTTPRTCKSPIFRLTPYLRTPKRRNFCIETNREVEVVRSPAHHNDGDECCSTLDIVTEKYSLESSSDEGNPRQLHDIKAMRDWSNAIGKAISRMTVKIQARSNNNKIKHEDGQGVKDLSSVCGEPSIGSSTM